MSITSHYYGLSLIHICTTGDIESTPFLEAIRQVSIEAGRENCL